MWDYDEAGTHILIDGEVAGQVRKLIAHSGRNGFFHAMERSNGQTVLAKPYVDTVTWTIRYSVACAASAAACAALAATRFACFERKAERHAAIAGRNVPTAVTSVKT
jgi:glucose dehydrogenase